MRYLILLFVLIFFLIIYLLWFQSARNTVFAGEDIEIAANGTVTLEALSSNSSAITDQKWHQVFGQTVVLTKIDDQKTRFIAPDVHQDSLLIFEYQEMYKDNQQAYDRVTVKVLSEKSLDDLYFNVHGNPEINQQSTIHITGELTQAALSVTFSQQPEQSTITPHIHQKTIYFTPKIPGHYELEVSHNGNKHHLPLMVKLNADFDRDKVVSLNNEEDLDKTLGIVSNQFWVFSNHLDSTDLQNEIEQYTSLSIIGQDSSNGFLITLDDTDIAATHELEQLSLSRGISYVLPRLYEGDDVDRLESEPVPVYTNDYTRWSSGQSENWHLVTINAPQAWSITQGNRDILIGISDGGYDTSHKELKGKIATNYLSQKDKSDNQDKAHIDHGTAVAGTLSAISHNKFGMSGINFTSKLVLHKVGFNAWNTLANHKKIKVVTASWAIPGYIPETFSPENNEQKSERAKSAFKLSRNFRAIAQKHPDKLFIFSAGNGIGNGKGNGKHYAVEGFLHSPSLHLSSLNSIDKVDNVIFVSALTYKGILSYSSTYGTLVDIAAPSYFKSLASDNNFKDDTKGAYGLTAGFKGTSAAAPVVAGVASLVFSVNPDLTGAQVKQILLQSAKMKVKERYTNPLLKKEYLHYPIPIVDAYGAVALAQKKKNRPVNLTFTLENAFEPSATIVIHGLPPQAHSIQSQTELHLKEASNDALLSALETTGKQFTLDISDDENVNHLESDITYIDPDKSTDDSDDQQVQVTLALDIARVNIDIVDHSQDTPLGNARLRIESLDKNSIFSTGKTDRAGQANLFLKPGSYKLYISHKAYQPATVILDLSANEVINKRIELIKETENDLGIIEGIVLDSQYEPIAQATIKLHTRDETMPNDFIASTDLQGYFRIENIPETNPNDEIITYELDISAEHFSPATLEPFAILSGQTISKDIQLFKVNVQDTNN